jgi:hypothetical protein
MTQGLRRFQESRQSYFLTFSCYRRQPNFSSPAIYDLFLDCLEDMCRRFFPCVYGYVVMPEHVHLLVSEPGRAQVSVQTADANLGHQASLADAMRYLKLGRTTLLLLPKLARKVHSRTWGTRLKKFARPEFTARAPEALLSVLFHWSRVLSSATPDSGSGLPPPAATRRGHEC